MDQTQVQHDLSIIKEMIAKTRKDTAQSGHFFIFIGIFSTIGTLIIGFTELMGYNNLQLPIVLAMTLVNGTLGFFVAKNEFGPKSVKTYAKSIFWNTWSTCGFAALLIVFVLPHFGVIQFSAGSILIALLFGIAVYLTGVIYDANFIKLTSVAWWLAAILLSSVSSPYSFLFMAGAFIFGWILPGIYLNRKFKNGGN